MRSRNPGDDKSNSIRLRVRFDYKGTIKRGKITFRSRNVEQIAEHVREHKVALLRNVPMQGISIEDIDMSPDVYTVYDDFSGNSVGFAPAIITLEVDSIEDAIQFVMKEEFRKVEILEPDSLTFDRLDIERFLFKANEELKAFKVFLEKKMEYWK
ncbi:MAG: hypothetical protein ACM3MK_06200 [Chitinophagales bacterium]